jgi:hypothetical protein
MTLGTALLAPFVPSRLAGLGLGIFSGSLFTIYLRTPGTTLNDGIRPSPEGTVLGKKRPGKQALVVQPLIRGKVSAA